MGPHTRRTGQFVAEGADGRKQPIEIHTLFHAAGTGDDPTALVRGTSELRTPEGLRVNRIAQGEYQIVQTGELLRSDDQNAP